MHTLVMQEKHLKHNRKSISGLLKKQNYKKVLEWTSKSLLCKGAVAFMLNFPTSMNFWNSAKSVANFNNNKYS